MLIRDARHDEFEEIGEIRVTAYQADGFLPPASGYTEVLRGLGADGLDQVLVAVGQAPAGGDQLLGTVMLQGWPRTGEVAKGPDEAEMRALAVRPEARGAGVGKALVAAVIARAAEAGVRHLVLLTNTGMKTARYLYEAAGFSRLPDRDWSPAPGIMLLAYGLVLDADRRVRDPGTRGASEAGARGN